MRKSLFSFHFKPTSVFALSVVLFFTVDLYGQTIFRDDFNRQNLGSAWQTRNWTIINNVTAFNNGGGPLRTTASFNDSSYTIETSAKGFTNNYYRQFRITFGQANLTNDSAYVLSYSQYGGGLMTLGRATDNIFYPERLDQTAIYPDYNSTQWYKFKITRYKSGLIQVYVNTGAGYGKLPLLEAIDSNYKTLGHLGWQEDTQTFSVGFYVDFIQAHKPAVEKPAVKEKPAEDNLITQVSAKSGNAYNVAKLGTGIKEFTDRAYTVTTVPSYLDGASFVQTAMADKSRATDDFLTLFVKKDAIVYIAYDPRATSIPGWLSKWNKTGDFIGTTDPGSPYLEIYSRIIESYEVFPYPLVLGGNLATPAFGAQMNYLVAAVERPSVTSLQAEDAVLSGAVVASDHKGYIGTGFADFKNAAADYIEWSVSIAVPGVYNLNFAYANGSTGDRPLQISDNGSNISILPFTALGSWDTWGFVSGPNVFLSHGIHKIRAIAIGSGGPNIDQLGLYYLSSATTPLIKPRVDLKRDYSYNQSTVNAYKVYPNPFASSTRIYYTLTEKAPVTLSVYNLQGQQMQLLVNEVKNAGSYEATFNAGKLSRGVYLYRLQVGTKITTGKMLKQ